MALFGLNLPDGVGTVGGEADEYVAALHPDDRHLMQHFHTIAHRQDFYEGEYRILTPDGSVRWVTGRALVVERDPDGKARRTVTVVADITAQKQAEEHVSFLLRELSHRSKNLFAIIQGIVHRTVRTSQTLAEFQQRFGARLAALSSSHNVLASQAWRAAPLDGLIREQLASFIETDSQRIHVAGPAVLINADAAQLIGLTIHELATNALKHGALSNTAGKVSVTWELTQDAAGASQAQIEWRESDGPVIATPTRKGFGQTLIKDMVERSLGASVEIDFAGDGLRWTATVPMAALSAGRLQSLMNAG
jgi:two-component sensor histidine kinase